MDKPTLSKWVIQTPNLDISPYLDNVYSILLYESKEDFSIEECCAEVTAAAVCNHCGVDSQASIKNSAAYLQGWSKFISDNAQAFVTAVNQAYKARDFILNNVEQEQSV